MAHRRDQIPRTQPASLSDYIIPQRGKRPLRIAQPKNAALSTLSTPSDSSSARTPTPNTDSSVEAPLRTVVAPVSVVIPFDSNKKHDKGNVAARTTQHIDSSLDIYAPKYVPLWLTAVNESYASIKPCQPLTTINLNAYVASFAGTNFLQPITATNVPAFDDSSPTAITNEPLSTFTYAEFWLKRLRNEHLAQENNYHNYTLYEVPLSNYNTSQHLYALRVPGLRENAPRIDIGDTVHIRSLANVLVPNIGKEVDDWYKFGRFNGKIAPGFSGQAYDAQVWSINRATDSIVLRIDGFFHATCNVLFSVQKRTYEVLYRSVQSIAEQLSSTFSHEHKWIHSILFPELRDGRGQHQLSSATFQMSWIDENLNWEQKKAVNSICRADYGTMPYLISGPPGTGKTKTLVELALQMVKKTNSCHLLICAPSDAAADTLASRLAKHLSPDELFRLNGWTRTFAEVPGNLLPYSYVDNNLFSLPPFQRLISFRIVVTTCRDADLLVRARLTNQALHSLMSAMSDILSWKSNKKPLHWSGVLIDEAAQATEPEILAPLAVVMPPSDVEETLQVVAAGDEFQLGPKVITRNQGLETSYFQRIFEREVYAKHPLSRSNGAIQLTARMLPIMRPAFTNLIRNYRSHPAILSVPSTLFYKDTLVPECTTSQDILSWPGWRSSGTRWPVMFKQNSGSDAVESINVGNGTGSGAVYNMSEADIAFDLVSSLLNHMTNVSYLSAHDIVVMSPFRAQVTYLRQKFRSHGYHDVNIGPMEAFQGLEARVVVICTTRTQLGSKGAVDKFVRQDQSMGLGMIDEPKRFNVAITRAKEALIVIGDARCLTCTGDHQWISFLAFCKRNDLIDMVPDTLNWGALHDRAAPPGRLEKAMKYATNLGLNRITNTIGRDQPGSLFFELKGRMREMDDTIDDQMTELPYEDHELEQIW